MPARDLGSDGRKALEKALGYLNFSSGAPDPQFLANLNALYQRCPAAAPPPWQGLLALLREGLAELSRDSAAFQNAEQAAAALDLLEQAFLPAYRRFHQDLLFHQPDEALYNAFFLGRAWEAILQQGAPWSERERIVAAALDQFNDHVGHRPCAVLETRRCEPYEHEWVRPVPLYVRGAGVAAGPQAAVVAQALDLLRGTDEDILRSAHFDLEQLEELAVDPRAYDFDHPANKRPNYHFGQWDPHQLDREGRYRRFVVQHVTLDALLERTRSADLPPDEVQFEAAAVLAGTILMAAGISGRSPAAHDSTVTLTSLLPQIAAYRDQFYERLFTRIEGAHARRLKKEAAEKRQPFGGARQHLNSQLAARRASQLEHVHLARIFARMGQPEAAARQANVAPCASARMRCQIDCALARGRRALDLGQPQEAADVLPQVMDLLQRGIGCGAFVDPWNILGFDAQFPLFAAVENRVRDHRIDELIALLEQIFTLYARVWSEAAARDDQPLCQRIRGEFEAAVWWWRRFAAHEVSSVEAIDPLDAQRAAQHVAGALNLWHKGGAAAGDVGFWAEHASLFDTPRAYALVVRALLERRDFVASLALLVHWLSQAERIGLERGDDSFHELARCWLLEVRQAEADERPGASAGPARKPAGGWALTRKFLDYLEANAEEFARPPRLEAGAAPRRGPAPPRPPQRAAGREDDEEDEEASLFSAAYEEMVFRDSTDDGVEGSLDEGGPADDEDGLEAESRRVGERLAFLSGWARLWKLAVQRAWPLAAGPQPAAPAGGDAADAVRHWSQLAAAQAEGLLRLLDEVEGLRLPAPSGDHDSLVAYDRRRLLKEALLERIVAAAVETRDARLWLLAAAAAGGAPLDEDGLSDEEQETVHVYHALLRGDAGAIRGRWSGLLAALRSRPLLYVPLAKGGRPREIVAARTRQGSFKDLLSWLPRLGLFVEGCQLIDAARVMERNNPVGPGAVTEFDELFEIGTKALTESLVASAEAWQASPGAKGADKAAPRLLVACLEQLLESLLANWLAHSQTLRLSVLEKAKDRTPWRKLVAFIGRYGAELFTQKFFNLGNLRAILHQGVDAWLSQLEERPPDDAPHGLLQDLDTRLPRAEAVERLTLVLEAVVENYAEYRDYNSTTTQSDHGELLYMLLDFLRLRARYDRVAWNLKPVVWAHEVLVRRGQHEAAELGRRSWLSRIAEEADKYQAQLMELQKKYAMRMPTVADRIGERFTQPMLIDRIRAQVEPAVREVQQPGGGGEGFRRFEEEAEKLAQRPSGVGLDAPAWLTALEEEVDRVLRPPRERDPAAVLQVLLPSQPLTLDEIRRQLDEWMRHE